MTTADLLQAEILILLKRVARQRTQFSNLLHTIFFLDYTIQITSKTNFVTIENRSSWVEWNLFEEEALFVGHAFEFLGVIVDLLLVVTLLSLPVLYVFRQFSQLPVVAFDLLVQI